jgi:hypothetical protein
MAVRDHIKILGDMATKRAIKQFAARHHLVYFGHVDPRDDEYELVRGATVSTTHIDNHYTVGSIGGRDVLLVERRNKFAFPGKPAVLYKWLIMQFDLAASGLPHMFIDAHQEDETFYDTLFTELPHIQNITHIFSQRDPLFVKHCYLFGFPHQYAAIGSTLTPTITGQLAQHFQQFDFEIQDDRLYVYASKTRPAVGTLQDMATVGVWLADQLDQTVIS